MKIMIGLVVAILLLSAVLTLLIAGKSDEDYRGSAKKNTVNLTWIYAIVIILSFVALGIYIN